jgi:colanic acid/amylovoran biosynthesis protein
MRLLLIGNHTCGNRGDAAIARGLIKALENKLPDAEIVMTSRYPVSSSYLLGRPIENDLFHSLRFKTGRAGDLARRALPYLLLGAVEKPKTMLKLMPEAVWERIEYLKKFDAVIQVGGSFFVDLYGPRQFETPFAAILAGTPLLVIGHSMGPLGGKRYQRFVRALLAKSHRVTIREPISMELLMAAGMPLETVRSGSDTAWLVHEPTALPTVEKGLRPRIGITVRHLAPFDKRLNTSQEAYESAVASMCDRLIAEGYDIVAASTCTGIESYNRDDRMIALSIAQRVGQPEHFSVVMDELNDLELGQLFAKCAIVIGTRLHSAIIALGAGTPAVALNYEHKSEGIMDQLGLPELARPITALLDGSFTGHVLTLLRNIDTVKSSASKAVQAEYARASAMLDEAISTLR